ncbi:MAG: ATP-binding cassette domain-containing protein [Fimbriimonas sp.]|nr:ATP-binding cassette domain-containing protein [Fimbriimonas sp.]
MPYLFPVLITKDLGASYGRDASGIQGIELNIEPGTIHAVVGFSGSGKTTLANVLTGVVEHSSGTIHVNGQLTTPKELKDAAAKGIRVIHPARVSSGKMTVAEALHMEGIPSHFGLPDVKERNRRAAASLGAFGLADIDPTDLICSLPAGKQLLVSAAAAMSKPNALLILDDATSALTNSEAHILYTLLGQQRTARVAILFLTSDPEEALEVGDSVTVLRDGRQIATHDPEQVFAAQIVGEMLGRDISAEPTNVSRPCGPETVMRVEGLNVEHAVFGLSLKLRRGEVFGLLGLYGAGQSETVNAIGCALPRNDGEFYLRAASLPARIKTREQALANGIGLIAEPIGHPPGTTAQVPQSLIARYVRGLNESNPQKAPILNCLQANCFVLLMDGPTRGLNVACRFEVYRTIMDLSSQGYSMIAASTNADELMRYCDRIGIMVNGRIIRTVERTDFRLDRLTAILKGS